MLVGLKIAPRVIANAALQLSFTTNEWVRRINEPPYDNYDDGGGGGGGKYQLRYLSISTLFPAWHLNLSTPDILACPMEF